MSEYVYINEAGDVVKTEPKGKGRTKAEAVEREPGRFFVLISEEGKILNWPISEIPAQKEDPKTEQVEESIEEPDPESAEEKQDVDEDSDDSESESESEEDSTDKAPKRRRVKHIDASQQSTVEQVKESCSCLKVEEHDGVVTLIAPIVTSPKPPFDGVDFNSIYAKIELDRNSGNITVFGWDNEPDLVILNAFVKEENLHG